MNSYTYLMLLFFMNIGYSQIKTKPITEFSQKDTNNTILVDVRTAKEYARGHLKHAINVDWFRPDFAAQFDTIPKNRTIYVYCQKGGRSSKAAEVLDSLGYLVTDLQGGYDALLRLNGDR
ncbi:MAG TPA: rhodanese-like domain-containing protein [Eudoraea sp.]|nr:rhodanese-like domain-containing protein [Eudoraea sp.]